MTRSMLRRQWRRREARRGRVKVSGQDSLTTHTTVTTLHGGRLTLCVAAILAVGCASGEADHSGDSDVPHVELQEILRLGDSNSDGPDTFGRIGGVLLDADGRIVVADAMNHDMRVFSENGEFLYSFAREGEGPGEVRRPCCIATGPDGALWVRDVGNGRFNVYLTGESSAVYERTVLVPAEMAGARGLSAPLVFDDSARLVVVGRILTPENQMLRGHGIVDDAAQAVPTLLTRTMVTEPSDDSLAVHMVREREGGMLSVWYFYQPFGPSFVTTYAPGGDWARAVTSVPRVERYSVDGSLRHAIDVRISPVSLSDRERRISDSTLTAARTRGVEIPFSTPATKPPLAGLKFDTAGRLWVERTTADGEPREADVFDTDGNLVMRARWPRDIRLGLESWVGSDRVVGVGSGEFNEPHVVVMRMVPVQ